mgnify:CR=1 FL=1
MKTTFRPVDLQKLTGISYRQIQYWGRTGFLRPSSLRRGRYHVYTFADAISVAVSMFLRGKKSDKNRYSIQKLRKVASELAGMLPEDITLLRNLLFLFFDEGFILLDTVAAELGRPLGIPKVSEGLAGKFRVFEVAPLYKRINELWPPKAIELPAPPINTTALGPLAVSVSERSSP